MGPSEFKGPFMGHCSRVSCFKRHPKRIPEQERKDQMKHRHVELVSHSSTSSHRHSMPAATPLRSSFRRSSGSTKMSDSTVPRRVSFRDPEEPDHEQVPAECNNNSKDERLADKEDEDNVVEISSSSQVGQDVSSSLVPRQFTTQELDLASSAAARTNNSLPTFRPPATTVKPAHLEPSRMHTTSAS